MFSAREVQLHFLHKSFSNAFLFSRGKKIEITTTGRLNANIEASMRNSGSLKSIFQEPTGCPKREIAEMPNMAQTN